MRILLSGFEPFGGDAINPTQVLMNEVAARPLDFSSHELRAVVLPVTFEKAYETLRREIHAFDPDVVIAFGLAGGRSEMIELERVAINCIDCNIADNDGKKLVDQPIGTESAFFSTLPLRVMLEKLQGAGVPARISNSAGAYVCNFLMYRLLEESVRTRRRCGFIHVPYLPQQGKAPAMPPEALGRGLRAILAAL